MFTQFYTNYVKSCKAEMANADPILAADFSKEATHMTNSLAHTPAEKRAPAKVAGFKLPSFSMTRSPLFAAHAVRAEIFML